MNEDSSGETLDTSLYQGAADDMVTGPEMPFRCSQHRMLRTADGDSVFFSGGSCWPANGNAAVLATHNA